MDPRAPRLDAAHWLDTWDRARALPSALRPCAWLAPLLADDLHDGQRLAETLPIGRRDVRLAALHAALFGPRLEATAHCPRCGEHIEFELDASSLVTDASDAPDADGRHTPLDWKHGAFSGHARPPDSRDLLAISRCADEGRARRLLMARCVTATRDDEAVDAASLPEDVAAAVSASLARADANAISEIDLACPACEHRWLEAFAIDAFLGAALDHWAERTLDQVHRIAGAYGWSEPQILALAASRRSSYLARIDA